MMGCLEILMKLNVRSEKCLQIRILKISPRSYYLILSFEVFMDESAIHMAPERTIRFYWLLDIFFAKAPEDSGFSTS